MMRPGLTLASALIVVLALQAAALAKGRGFGAHGFHAVGKGHKHTGQFIHHFRQRKGLWPWYGTYVLPASVPEAVPSTPVVNYVLPASRPCHPVQQPVIVPAEAGGTTTVTVTRC